MRIEKDKDSPSLTRLGVWPLVGRLYASLLGFFLLGTLLFNLPSFESEKTAKKRFELQVKSFKSQGVD